MTPSVNPADPFQLIGYTMMTALDAVAAVPIYNPADPGNDLVISAKLRNQPIPPALRAQMSASGNGTQPPTHIQVGRALIILPSDVVKNIRGDQAHRDVMWLMVVRREVYDKAVRMAESGLVVPGVGGRDSRLIVPR